MQYFAMELDNGCRISINGPSKRFYSHTVNRFAGGLFLGPAPSHLVLSHSLDAPVEVPEETTLFINVVGNDLCPVFAEVRGLKADPNLVSENVMSLPVNFHSRVGTAFLDVRIGSDSFTVVIDVCPTKIDYDENFNGMLRDLQSMARDLIFDWLKPTSFAGTRESGVNVTSDIEFISSLHDSIDLLAVAIVDINTNSDKGLRTRQSFRRVDQLIVPSAYTVASASRGQGRGPWRRLDSGIAVREVLADLSNVNSTDTLANNWLKQQLERIRNRVMTVLHRVQSSRRAGQNEVEIKHLRTMLATLNRLLCLELFQGLGKCRGDVRMKSAASRLPRYSYVSDLLDVISFKFTLCSGVDLMNSRQISDLYEQWCFLKVASVVSELLHNTVDPCQAFSIDDESLRVRLRRGATSQITVCGSVGVGYSISYNREFKTITGTQRPDIVIQVDHGTLPSTLIILDAKYRVASSDSDPQEVESAPVDAINALHRYRDAIYVHDGSRQVRPVVLGAVLFPPSVWRDADLLDSPFWKSIESVGIGAIPLRPDNDSFLRDFLSSVLMMPYNELIRPGLPFEPYESYIRAGTQPDTVNPSYSPTPR